MDFDKIEWNINPGDLLRMQGLTFSKSGNWYTVLKCPFCDGGKSGQIYTFGVRTDDYNYHCLRKKCGNSGNFWKLLEFFGLDPKEYILTKTKVKAYNKSKVIKKNYIYGRKG